MQFKFIRETNKKNTVSEIQISHENSQKVKYSRKSRYAFLKKKERKKKTVFSNIFRLNFSLQKK